MSLYLGDQQIAGINTPVQGRVLGQIIQSTIPLVDAGLHLADGTLINGTGTYADFYNYMLELYGDGTNIPSYFTDETSWQSSITTYGVCGKFVLDTVNQTIRLPKITGIIEGTVSVSTLGDLIEAGLPNITATFRQLDTALSDASGSLSGALYGTSFNSWSRSGSDRQCIDGGFDASRSSAIYGNSNTVQPQTVKAYIYIVIATLTKTNIEVDIDNIVTDLNGKADKDLVNVSPSDVRNALDNANVRYIIGTYRNGFSWHNIYSDGWVEQGGRFKTNSSTGYKDINLLVEMADTNFSIYAIRGAQSTTSNYDVWVQNPDYTASTTMIRIYISNTSAYVYWKVAGQSKTS